MRGQPGAAGRAGCRPPPRCRWRRDCPGTASWWAASMSVRGPGPRSTKRLTPAPSMVRYGWRRTGKSLASRTASVSRARSRLDRQASRSAMSRGVAADSRRYPARSSRGAGDRPRRRFMSRAAVTLRAPPTARRSPSRHRRPRSAVTPAARRAGTGRREREQARRIAARRRGHRRDRQAQELRHARRRDRQVGRLVALAAPGLGRQVRAIRLDHEPVERQGPHHLGEPPRARVGHRARDRDQEPEVEAARAPPRGRPRSSAGSRRRRRPPRPRRRRGGPRAPRGNGAGRASRRPAPGGAGRRAPPAAPARGEGPGSSRARSRRSRRPAGRARARRSARGPPGSPCRHRAGGCRRRRRRRAPPRRGRPPPPTSPRPSPIVRKPVTPAARARAITAARSASNAGSWRWACVSNSTVTRPPGTARGRSAGRTAVTTSTVQRPWASGGKSALREKVRKPPARPPWHRRREPHRRDHAPLVAPPVLDRLVAAPRGPPPA